VTTSAKERDIFTVVGCLFVCLLMLSRLFKISGLIFIKLGGLVVVRDELLYFRTDTDLDLGQGSFIDFSKL